MTLAGMAASRCGENGNHRMQVWRRATISGRLIMRCAHCSFSSYWWPPQSLEHTPVPLTSPLLG